MDAAGNLYGTTVSGGYANDGVVFELTPNASRTAWTETVIHAFKANNAFVDGEGPYAGLMMDAAGNIYGTTTKGGKNLNGVVFELTPNAARTVWTESILYAFCADSHCVDGFGPYAGLTMDAAGNLYGTTQAGGTLTADGVVFELDSKPSSHSMD